MIVAKRGRAGIIGSASGFVFWSLVFCLGGPAAWADSLPTGAAKPAAAAPTAPAGASDAAKPDAAKPDAAKPDAAKPEGQSETDAKIIDVAAKPTAILSGQAKWGDGFSAIMDAEAKIKAAVDKAGLKTADRPITVFTATDDNGFSYQAMLPLADKPQGKDELPDGVKLGNSPAGKAIKFEHHGPYDDIDATYDAITAYLDEKGLEAQDYFVEEYATDLKSADDPGLAVNIYVFIK